MSLEVRTVSESEFPDWNRTLDTGFLRPPVAVDAVVAGRLAHSDLNRTLGAFDRGRCVATFRSFTQELTVPGGAVLSADAITNVAVLPTHRRRGLLSRMMAADLTAATERGDAVATLISAEYPIYGRYGFGPAAGVAEWAIDVPRTGLDPRWSGPVDGGRVDLVDAADVRKLGPELYERFRLRQHGATDRDAHWWQVNTGETPTGNPWTEPFYAVHRSAAGEVEGLAAYTADDVWGDNQPKVTATVRKLIAVTPRAERALWQFLCSIDWITTVRTGFRAQDDLLPQFLPDPRAARIVAQSDFLWVRILDTVRALEARTYAVPGTVVLDVHDRAESAAGRFRLEVSPTGEASCTTTTDSPDLVLDVRELSALYLGDESVPRLVALGAVSEERPGAAAVAETLFRTARRPWCPDVF